MNKKEYLYEIESRLKDFLNDEKLKRHLAQINAEKLNVEFNKSYDESYLWEKSLFLSSNACFLLEDDLYNETAIKSLKLAAEIYENLYHVTNEYDKKYILLLSSLCYDISGYQANAKCLIDEIEKYEYYTVEDNNKNLNIVYYENIFLKTIQFFLQKKIFLLNNEIDLLDKSDYSSLNNFYKRFFKNYILGIKNLSSFILNGFEITKLRADSKNLINKFINQSYKEILYSGNILLSHLMYLFKIRIDLFSERNIWDVMDKYIDTNNHTWNTYFKLLTTDLYSDYRLKDINKRISVFEFWNSQLNALKKDILLNDENYIVKMPTSAGKTFIAEIMILNALIKNPKSKALYIAPFNALVHQVKKSFSKIEKLRYNISFISGAYEIDELDDSLIQQMDILVATPEKVDLLYRINYELFDNISIIIIDEGHIVGDGSERSILLELLISKLKRKLKKTRFFYISALLSEEDAIDFSKWICENEDNILSSPIIGGEEWEPTRKLIGYLEWNNKKGDLIYPYKKLENDQIYFVRNIIEEKVYKFTNPITNRKNTKSFPTNDKYAIAIELAYKLISDGSVLIFSPQPRLVDSIGNHFLKYLDYRKYSNENVNPIFNPNNLKSMDLCLNLLGEDHIVTKCLMNGIAIHHGELPKDIRNSIEEDFKDKNIEILIASNTIGQGINFPIKTVIFHSLYFDNNQTISKRDFWNIVGRGGRAGKETEGQIICLSLNKKDEKNFYHYTNKNNIEPLKSFLLKIIEQLHENIIKDYEFEELLKSNVEPSLLNILFEESIDKLDEQIIEETLEHSLFYIQNENENDRNHINSSFKKIGNRLYSDEISINLREIYTTTGLSLDSCFELNKFIINNLEDINECVSNKNYSLLIKYLLQILIKLKEMNENKINNSLFEENFDNIVVFIEKWVHGDDMIDLLDFWNKHFYNSKLEINFFINKYLEFRYPWGINAFLLILLYHSNNKFKRIEDYPEEIKNIPSFIKYGLNKKIACFCKNIGIFNRKVCLEIDKLYEHEFITHEVNSFLNWFSSLEFGDLKNHFSKHEINNILTTSQNIAIKKKNIDVIKFNLTIKDNFIQYFNEINIGDYLILNRGYAEHNIYNINLSHNKTAIGTIPTNISKFLAIEIDINNTLFDAIVLDKNTSLNYITIEINKNSK
jgi:replicative superfamily II helicase